MTDSNLVSVLQAQSRSRAAHVGYEHVRNGAGAIVARIDELRASGAQLLLIDTLFEEDLSEIAEAAADLLLMTGSSSVAAHPCADISPFVGSLTRVRGARFPALREKHFC